MFIIFNVQFHPSILSFSHSRMFPILEIHFRVFHSNTPWLPEILFFNFFFQEKQVNKIFPRPFVFQHIFFAYTLVAA